jgi:hypothetical protein
VRDEALLSAYSNVEDSDTVREERLVLRCAAEWEAASRSGTMQWAYVIGVPCGLVTSGGLLLTAGVENTVQSTNLFLTT